MVRTLCAHLVLDSLDGETLSFCLAPPGQKIFEDTHKDKLTQALSQYFETSVEIRVRPVDGAELDQETPAEYADRCYREALIKAEQDIMASPTVQSMVAEFDAELIPGSVRLINSDRN